MDSQSARIIFYFVALGLSAVFGAWGLGKIISSSVESIARQPEAATKIQTTMIIGCAFVEALTIYVLISIFLVK
jgi:F-type H+-transporting ATPase subunit c